jgi:D-aminoacyl-tRNA deacylase
MRCVLQRVTSASVSVHGRLVGEIGAGLVALVGVAKDDAPADIGYIASKIRDLRIFGDEQGRLNRSIVEAGGGVLVVSQFTLLADVRKGRRPAFDEAAPAEMAKRMYESLVEELRANGLRVETGVFQAMMQVSLVNDGPVTLWLDSKRGGDQS